MRWTTFERLDLGILGELEEKKMRKGEYKKTVKIAITGGKKKEKSENLLQVFDLAR